MFEASKTMSEGEAINKRFLTSAFECELPPTPKVLPFPICIPALLEALVDSIFSGRSTPLEI